MSAPNDRRQSVRRPYRRQPIQLLTFDALEREQTEVIRTIPRVEVAFDEADTFPLGFRLPPRKA